MTSEHDVAWEMIPWYVTGTLPEAERRRVAAHLSACRACRAELAEQTRLRQILRDETVADRHAASAWRDTMRHVAAPRSAPWPVRRRGAAWAAGALAATCLIAVVSWPFLRNGQAPNDFITLTAPGPEIGTIRILPRADADPAELRSLFEGHALRTLPGAAPSDLIVAWPTDATPADIVAILQRHAAIAYVVGVDAE